MSLPTAVLANDYENGSDILGLYVNPVDGRSGPIGHDGFQKLGVMYDLLVEYSTILRHMQVMYDAVMQNRHDESWRMSCDSCNNSIKHTLAAEHLFCVERARCALDEKYWQKLLNLTGIEPFTSTTRYGEWNKSLRTWQKSSEPNLEKPKPVTLNEESIFSTAFALSGEKKDYFAQMVHGVFRKLFTTHKTDRAQGFSNKLIIASCLPSRDSRRSYGYLNRSNGLRKVTGLMYGRSGAEDVSFTVVKEYMMSDPDEWVSVDNDSLKMREFINGDVCILVEEETYDNLNLILSYSMSDYIPPDRRYTIGHSSARTVEINKYRSQLMSFFTVNSLVSYADDHFSVDKHRSPGPHTSTPRNNRSIGEREELVSIQESLGTVRRYREAYDFDFSLVEAFKLLALHGSIPDHYIHQFYATIGELQKRVIDGCVMASGMHSLEPSIGLGALLKGLPEGVDVTSLDIYPATIAIASLRWSVTLNDFLLVKPENTRLFEKILMSPPFSETRQIAHLQHAMRFLEPGRHLIAVLSGNVKGHILNREVGLSYDINILGCYDNTFGGTDESTKLFSVDAHEQWGRKEQTEFNSSPVTVLRKWDEENAISLPILIAVQIFQHATIEPAT